ncbi:soluble scavenger receptor cysteine-rich domain-containing protein SSC5D-like, partial [Trachemys scripta elegans]|uniref:soluble scavenger receptor cysteine-rich domain-containing protein SSC5D-like n=1 Tax=Trachemys scripta elegans TaxID=31138 RepID=UPI001551E9BF
MKQPFLILCRPGPRACSPPATMRLPLLLLVGFLEFHYTGPFLVRLAGGPSECVGRVEINYKGRWGSVCDDEWDLADAAVVCRQLGCGTVLSAPVGAWFGEGTGPIWLNEVRCQGSEQHLRHCRHRGWRQHVCSHEEDASAVCSVPALGRSGADTPRRPCVPYSVVWLGLWVCADVMACSISVPIVAGTDPSRAQGPHSPCGHVSVSLSDPAVPTAHRFLPVITTEPSVQPALGDHKTPAQSTARPASTTPEHSGAPLRLVGGPHSCAGRLEVLHGSQWGSVCDDGWGLLEGAVVCRELGCGAVQAAPGGAHFGTGTGPIWLDDVGCSGKEISLRQCRARPWGRTNCQHDEDASVICTGTPQSYPPPGTTYPPRTNYPTELPLPQSYAPRQTTYFPSYTSPPSYLRGAVLRLVGGAGSCSGRLEVFHQGRWGTVCDDMWALPGAAVVCRELGCGDPLSAPRGAFFGEGSGPIWLDNVRCQGNESALSRCLAAPWGVHDCQHAEDAGVVCTDELAPVRQRFAKPMAPQPRMQKPRTQKPRTQKPRPRLPSVAREETQAPAQVSPQAVLPGKWKPLSMLEGTSPREAAQPEGTTRSPPPSGEPELPTAGPVAQAVTDAAMRVSGPRDGPRPERHGAPGMQRPVQKNRRPRPKPLGTRTDAVRHRAPAATPTLRARAGARTDPHVPRPPLWPGDSTLTTVASATHPPSQPHSAWTSPATPTPTP